MRKLVYTGGLVTVLLVATIVLAAPHHGPEEVVIDAAMTKRAAVDFPHAKHQEMVAACDTCHHQNEGMTADNAEGMEVQPCEDCHLDPEKEDTPSMRELSLKKNPFHIACIDCHKTEAKGPTKCDECHPKAEGE